MSEPESSSTTKKPRTKSVVTDTEVTPKDNIDALEAGTQVQTIVTKTTIIPADLRQQFASDARRIAKIETIDVLHEQLKNLLQITNDKKIKAAVQQMVIDKNRNSLVQNYSGKCVALNNDGNVLEFGNSEFDLISKTEKNNIKSTEFFMFCVPLK